MARATALAFFLQTPTPKKAAEQLAGFGSEQSLLDPDLVVQKI
jgi:hypothetical protein